MAVMNDRGEVRAAGGVVTRRTADGAIEVVVVHRPKYDDWTLPKGKVDPGETDEDCAVREVEEETGLSCRLGHELPAIRYEDRYGRPKVVRYWLMEVEKGSLAPRDEVDAAEWLTMDRAIERLSYDRDVEVLDGLAARGQTSG